MCKHKLILHYISLDKPEKKCFHEFHNLLMQDVYLRFMTLKIQHKVLKRGTVLARKLSYTRISYFCLDSLEGCALRCSLEYARTI